MPAFKLSLTLLLMVTLADRSLAHPEYRLRIPNSMNVVGYEAIGHIDKGHGKRNPFGDDFKAAGKQWTKELCQQDSDGDGQTNGQELGDPCCEWVQNVHPLVRWIDGVSAPGDATSKSDASRWVNMSCSEPALTATTDVPTTVGTDTSSGPSSFSMDATACGIMLGTVAMAWLL